MVGLGRDLDHGLLEQIATATGGVSVALTDFSAGGLRAALGGFVGGGASVTHPDIELCFQPAAGFALAW
ncbi:MAG: hypothetical protein EBU46_20635, partial [Nitrosomonadaceae bacterium]|nr:hypothetical protein [Nitrosomonadaceae bacterium]